MFKSTARFRTVVRMDRETFIRLVNFLHYNGELESSRFICAAEKVMIFVSALVGFSIRQIAERFQHSLSTISILINEITKCFLTTQNKLFIKPSYENTPSQILNNPKFYPYFQNCVGAIDGCHISAIIPNDEQASYRNRKGFLSQNVLAVINFDMVFSYVLAGWEGSAHDGKVYKDAFCN
jgi:hypothetical protein